MNKETNHAASAGFARLFSPRHCFARCGGRLQVSPAQARCTPRRSCSDEDRATCFEFDGASASACSQPMWRIRFAVFEGLSLNRDHLFGRFEMESTNKARPWSYVRNSHNQKGVSHVFAERGNIGGTKPRRTHIADSWGQVLAPEGELCRTPRRCWSPVKRRRPGADLRRHGL